MKGTKIFAHGRWEHWRGCRKAGCSLYTIFQREISRNFNCFLGILPSGTGPQWSPHWMPSEHGLAFTDWIGKACDGAVVMVGEHNSVWLRIKKGSSNFVLNKCVCHSLALGVQKAFEVLPSNLGYLPAEIPGWFSHSTLWRKNYIKFFAALREENENEKSQLNLPFTKAFATRLVWGRIIKGLLENWEELEAYFKCAMQESTEEARYKDCMLYHMQHVDVNYLYFLYCLLFSNLK